MLRRSGLSGQWAGAGEEEEEAAELKHAKRPAHLELGSVPAGHSRERAVRPLSLRRQEVGAEWIGECVLVRPGRSWHWRLAWRACSGTSHTQELALAPAPLGV